MKTLHFTYLCLLLSLQANAQKLPATAKRPVVDTYFGKSVTDNYRWLEDMNSSETKDWFKAQGDYSNSVLDQIPGRDILIKTFREYDALKTATIGGVKLRAGLYFYRKTLPSEKVGKIYFRAGRQAREELLFDPVAYDSTKTYAVVDYTPTDDGKRVAIGLTEGGNEIATVLILDMATRKLLPDQIISVFGGGVTWTPDGHGLIYTPQNSLDPKDPNGGLDTQARYHQLGTNASSMSDKSGGTDPVLLSRSKYPTLGIRPDQTPILFYDEQHTHLFSVLSSVDNRLNVFLTSKDSLQKPRIDWQQAIAPEDSIYGFGVAGGKLFLHSVQGASNGKILVTDARTPNVKTATVLLPEGKLNITAISLSRDYLFVTLNDGINDLIRQYNISLGKWTDVPLPASGTARMYPLDPTTNDCLLLTTTWKQPVTRYSYDPVIRKITISPFHIGASYPGLDELVVEELEVPSYDGQSGVPVMVPLSLIYKKGMKRDGNVVCFMTGYGAYGSSAIPNFSIQYLALLNKGVLVAITHPRGGSEKGESWHTGGYKTTKPNTWKDFIACGDYLVKNKYTSPAHLIGMGRSAGGILIGRAITERPDLFAAAINNVGCTSMLRTELTPTGPANIPEFGTVKDSVEFNALYEMDALHHVQQGVKYPAVICVGGWNDYRVMVWEPGKFAAALQNASASGKPVLMQVNYDNGHFTEDKSVTFRDFANIYAFALWQAGHTDFQPSVAETKN
ncbi:prolyl oligopeptidase family serine peptidase [Dyadobacter sp. NIV53]|uniref:prolyl oligopeptidase family serine peptidase n=1 Tax=Dyadobacter sp. NIV53 TaxID=2861765 RepID=UPI001C874077|nr:prolyl oligopeptidase family serine peptidase [Dyadobacter sp. NIV53]